MIAQGRSLANLAKTSVGATHEDRERATSTGTVFSREIAYMCDRMKNDETRFQMAAAYRFMFNGLVSTGLLLLTETA